MENQWTVFENKLGTLGKASGCTHCRSPNICGSRSGGNGELTINRKGLTSTIKRSPPIQKCLWSALTDPANYVPKFKFTVEGRTFVLQKPSIIAPSLDGRIQ